MTTSENWSLDHRIILVEWKRRLTVGDLTSCFHHLRVLLDEAAPSPSHILFDIRMSGHIPAQAPVIAIQSRFLDAENLGKVAVVSEDIIAQVLASTASSVTRHKILFFPLYESAVAYLQSTS